MKNSHLGSWVSHKMVLFLCGLIVTSIAAAILIATDAADLSYAIALGRDRQLNSALKASAIALLVAGAVILAGTFRMRRATLATATAAAVFLALGVSQSLDLLLDGIQEEEAVVAALAEIAIGTISLLNLNYYRKQFQF